MGELSGSGGTGSFLNKFSEDEGSLPVKNYSRVVADFLLVILMKRWRSGHFMGVKKDVEWAWTAVFGLYIHMYMDYMNICIWTI